MRTRVGLIIAAASGPLRIAGWVAAVREVHADDGSSFRSWRGVNRPRRAVSARAPRDSKEM